MAGGIVIDDQVFSEPAPPSDARPAAHRLADRWPGIAALLATAVLLTLLPTRPAGGAWVPLAVALALVGALAATRHPSLRHLRRWAALAIPAVATAGVAAGVLLQATGVDDALVTHDLLLDAALVWAANVLAFALWYWEIDGGGPARRRRDQHASDDIQFPQMTLSRPGPAWFPTFLDYLFFSFNTSTAFSPTDATALSRRAKLLMMAESSVSLVVVAVLVARANTGR